MFKKNSISINHRMIISIVMTLFLVVAAIAPMALPQLANADATTIFVNAGATGGTYNGDSWATAYTTLYEALTDAQTSSKDIWVAAGTYYPDTSGFTTDIREATFQMINGVAIYGGFAGTEDPATFNL